MRISMNYGSLVTVLVAAGMVTTAASAGTFGNLRASVDLVAQVSLLDPSGSANGGIQSYVNSNIMSGSFAESRTSTATTPSASASLTEGISFTQSGTLLSSTMTTRMVHPAMTKNVNAFGFNGGNAQEFQFVLTEATQVRFTQNFASLFLNSGLIWFYGPGNAPVFAQAIAPVMFFPGTADVTLTAGVYHLGYSIQPDYSFPTAFGPSTLPATDVTAINTLSLEIIPAPSAGAVAGIAMLAAVRRRR
jgi:hypothetical protein